MGGLVIRSALYYGLKNETLWSELATKICYLGSPHHGSTLEQAGNYLDVILEKTPFASPFAKLGKIRSAGVTDLRYGSIVDEDWEDVDRFKLQGDMRKNIPLPIGIKHNAIAGSIGKSARSVKAKLLGDNMVGINSALGKHAESDKNLNFNKRNTWVAYECTHMDLLSSAAVYIKLKSWLS